MSNKISAETQEDIDAFLDRKLSDLPSLPIVPEAAINKAATDTGALPNYRAMFDAARAMRAEAVVPSRTGRLIPASTEKRREIRKKAYDREYAAKARAEKREAVAALVASLKTETRVRLSLAEWLAEARPLRRWLAIDHPRQRQFRPRTRLYLAARIVAVEIRRESGAEPKVPEFAERLSAATGAPIDRHAARGVLTQLTGKLEGRGGPWDATPCRDQQG